MNSSQCNTQTPSYFAFSSKRDQPIPNDRGILKDKSKLIAFYLPQFHRITENSRWWGEGFTEWTNVAKATPNYKGHYQPHIPRNLGFYDLSHVEVMYEQVELARDYGIYGFCFYYYWFSGKRILECPLDNFLKSDIDFPFCLCWANENWTRTWDGREKEILLLQKYEEDDEEQFIQSLIPFFLDSRYIKVDNKPMLVIYRIKELPDPSRSIKQWRSYAEKAGFPGLFILVVDFYDIKDPREVGADGLVEFPPHKYKNYGTKPDTKVDITNPLYDGRIFDYVKVIIKSAYRDIPDFPLYRGIMPGWDNTPRRQNSSTIIINNTPELFRVWLQFLRKYNRIIQCNDRDSFIFVNAWNEWGEGCHLEPDLKWELQFLEEIARTSWYDGNAEQLSITDERDRLLSELESIVQRNTMLGQIIPVDIKPPNLRVEKLSQTFYDFPGVPGLVMCLYRIFTSIKDKI